MKGLSRLRVCETTPPAIITLDAEKAFDNDSFQWLSLVMQKFGISGPFYHFIQNLYSSPSATVIASGIQSNSIRLHKGTRQGCPLSPLLFNLAIEPLSRYLNTTALIQGITFGHEELRAALFADDILLFTTSPQTDIPAIQNIFNSFRKCSGLRINFAKSEILPLGAPTFRPWLSSSPFNINEKHITYLGIKIGKDPSSLYHLNYPPLISKIIGELEAWSNLPLSLFGRCALFKMVLLAFYTHCKRYLYCLNIKMYRL